MKYKLVLLKPVSDGDSFGEETPHYSEFRTVAAERVKTTVTAATRWANISPTIAPSSTYAMPTR